MNITKHHLDAMLVSSSINIGYLTACLPARQGFFGFSKNEREAFLLITNNNKYLLTDGRYIEEVKKTVKGFEIVEITSNNPFKKILKTLIKKHKIKHLGFEKNNLTYAEYKYLTSDGGPERSRRNSSEVELVPSENVIENRRAIKNKNEVSAIEKACALGDKTFDYILGKIKPGITEKQLAFEIEFFIKKSGADISFPPIVAFGANSAIPHHQTSNQSLELRGQLILLDFGVKLNNYCSDMTRTVFFGKATHEQKKIYHTVLEAQKRAIEHLGRAKDTSGVAEGLPRGGGIKASEVDRLARDYIIKAGFPTIPHSLGHGIGLEIHELPRLSPKSKNKLKPGMVFSVEPGIYLPAGRHGIPNSGGVRIEDLVVLEPSGPRILTKSTKEIIEI